MFLLVHHWPVFNGKPEGGKNKYRQMSSTKISMEFMDLILKIKRRVLVLFMLYIFLLGAKSIHVFVRATIHFTVFA